MVPFPILDPEWTITYSPNGNLGSYFQRLFLMEVSVIRSMTGFGQGRAEAEGTFFRVEMRSVNNRFREVVVKLPRYLMPLEDRIKGQVGGQVARGRVEVYINLEGGRSFKRPRLDLELAEGYLKSLRELQDRLRLPGRPDLPLLAGFRDIIDLAEEPPEASLLWPGLRAALGEALDGLVEMRRVEGEKLVKDLESRVELLKGFTAEMEQAAPLIVEANQQRLRERIQALMDQEVEPERLTQEAAILADKSDVTEELVRLRSHLDQFQTYLDEGGVVGRKLDFLVQEIHREINTSGVKLNQAELAQKVVEAKAELEKIREQIQNLE